MYKDPMFWSVKIDCCFDKLVVFNFFRVDRKCMGLGAHSFWLIFSKTLLSKLSIQMIFICVCDFIFNFSFIRVSVKRRLCSLMVWAFFLLFLYIVA